MNNTHKNNHHTSLLQHTIYCCCIMLCLLGYCNVAVAQEQTAEPVPITQPILQSVETPVDTITSLFENVPETTLLDTTAIAAVQHEPAPITNTFNPDGMRAVWLSALLPGLGQIYNRRYWKLPIVVGGFMGLAYATSWNGRMLADYQQAYLDIMDTDPNTNSYMDFFPPYYTEEDLDRTWLTNILKQRKDSYRHYRDYCIVGIVAVYLICILDAYVDAELYNFDMSTDLSMDVKPALIPISKTQMPAIGLQCAITF